MSFPAQAGRRNRATTKLMTNLLTDRLIRVDRSDGTRGIQTLPGVLEAMALDRVMGFPALRPHQRHAWHAFLAQLGVLALMRAGKDDPVLDAHEWRQLLRGLSPGFVSDEPWRLVVEDTSMPAFLQCPVPDGQDAYKRVIDTPDDLDLLVTSKNHDLKSAMGREAHAEEWLFALVSLQTMAGFLGAGNYGIARMNGGYSSRPCLGLAPAEGGVGAHMVHDIHHLIRRRSQLLDGFPDYFDPEDGLSLVWIEPWDGISSLRLDGLDPHFIEICRRVRLWWRNERIVCRAGHSKKRRIAAAEAKGNLGDHWTPVSVDGKALSLSSVGFRYDRLHKLILDGRSFNLPPAMTVDATSDVPWRLVARGVAAGQGKTEGYHERTDILLGPRMTRSLLGGGEERSALASMSRAQIEEINEVTSALSLAIAIAASGGKETGLLSRFDREQAYPYLRRLDALADGHFFSSLQERFDAAAADRSEARRSFARRLIRSAKVLLQEAIESVPCARIHRFRAQARATSAFWWRLRRPESVFSDQDDIFETSNPEENSSAT